MVAEHASLFCQSLSEGEKRFYSTCSSFFRQVDKKISFSTLSAFSSGLEVVTLKAEDAGEDILLITGFTSKSSSGVLAIDAKDGTQRWRKTLHAKPTNHDCHLVRNLLRCVYACDVLPRKRRRQRQALFMLCTFVEAKQKLVSVPKEPR